MMPPPSLEPSGWDFLNALADGVYGIDREGRCLFINDAALRMLGYAGADTLVGRNMHDAIHHTRANGTPYAQAECSLFGALVDGVPVVREKETLWRRDGSSFLADCSAFPRADSTCIVTISDAAIRTDTPKRPTERSARENEPRFRTIANSIPQLSWMTDASGSITWYNQRWYDYTGTTLADVVGWNWKTVHHPDHVERVERRFRRSIEAEESWEDTFPLRSRDGQYCWFLSRAMPIHDEPDEAHPKGRLLGWFGTNTDITAIRDAEHKLETARDEAEAANRAKSTFIANMSHELRTPLSAIIGYAEMLTEEIEDGSAAEDLSRDITKIEGNARHLLGLINNVLDLSKVESGKMEAFTETFEVRQMAEDVASTVGALMEKKSNRSRCGSPTTSARCTPT